jgi:hypothetical protein
MDGRNLARGRRELYLILIHAVSGILTDKHQDSLPADDQYPSCYLGGHIWLDKGLVSTKVKMHPILWRGCWIQSATRNGSGNGGATLLGFVNMVSLLLFYAMLDAH